MLHIEKKFDNYPREPRWADITPKGFQGDIDAARKQLRELTTVKPGETYRIINVLETVVTKQPAPILEVVNSEEVKQPITRYTSDELRKLARKADSGSTGASAARSILSDLCGHYGIDPDDDESWIYTVSEIISKQSEEVANEESED